MVRWLWFVISLKVTLVWAVGLLAWKWRGLCISCFVILLGSVGLLAWLTPSSLVVPFSSFGRYGLNSLVFCCFLVFGLLAGVIR